MINVQVLGFDSDHCQVYSKEIMCQSLDCLTKYKLEAQSAGAVRVLFDCALAPEVEYV